MLVLAHMRSQSSLLAHLLASHPHVAGHSELQRGYATRLDLASMRRLIEERQGGRAPARWLVDKLLHDYLPVDRAILARPEVRGIVLLRRPRAAIASILRLGRDRSLGGPERGPAEAAAYYAARLATVVAMAQVLAPRLRFVRSEDLVGTPERVLDGLTRFLALAPPLAATYRVFPTTGVHGQGDPSPFLRAGRVLRDDERVDPVRDAIEVPDEALAGAQAAYDDAVARLAPWAV